MKEKRNQVKIKILKIRNSKTCRALL